MRLNSLVPAEGSRPAKKRVGRGIGCGSGKTCGRGHKGQKARSGGGAKFGFEGGQMPIQRRLPKSGFNSKLARRTAELRLDKLAKVEADVIDMLELIKSGLVKASKIDRVKIIASGKLDKAVHVRGIKVTAGARAAIEAAGGKVED